jgi:hypothetical protein
MAGAERSAPAFLVVTVGWSPHRSRWRLVRLRVAVWGITLELELLHSSQTDPER